MDGEENEVQSLSGGCAVLDPGKQELLFHLAFTGSHELERLHTQEGQDLSVDLYLDTFTGSCICSEAFEELVFEDNHLTDILEQLCSGCCSCELEEGCERRRASISLLHIAAAQGHTWLVQYLLANGADVNRQTRIHCFTALQLAAHNWKCQPPEELVQALLDAGANPNIQENFGQTALHMAAELNYAELIALLAKAGCSLNISNHESETALYCALSLGFDESVEMLVRCGADIDLAPSSGSRPLILAVRNAHIDIVRILLSVNCDLDSAGPGNQKDTALHCATYRDSSDILQLLLEAGADPDVQSDGGLTPLMVAAYSNFQEIAKLLLEYRCDVNMLADHGYTALHLAAWDGHLEIVQMLLRAGCVHDSKTSDKNTPVALACHGNYLPVVRCLLQLQCDVNNADKDLDTPIHYASYNGCVETIKLLLEHGADVNAENSAQATALWNAVYMGHQQVFELLLQYNAQLVQLDVTSRGANHHVQQDHPIMIYDDAMTPFQVACKKGFFSMAKMLVLAGSDMHKEQWLWSHRYPSCLDEDDNMKCWLNNHVFTPLELTHLCRTLVRRMLCTNLKAKVIELEMPVTLHNFLLLKEI